MKSPIDQTNFDPEFRSVMRRYLARLRVILGDTLTQDEAIALTEILTIYAIEFEDGDNINTDGNELSIPAAATLAACFRQTKDSEKNESHWKMEFLGADRASPAVAEATDRLLRRFRAHRSVRDLHI